MYMQILTRNKKALFDYEIIEQFEAGLCLIGPEVKSILNNKCSISESYIKIKNGEAFIQNMHVSRYNKVDGFNVCVDETRERKLLLHKKQIIKLEKFIKEKGLTIIPLSVIYSDSRKIKLEIAVGRGKKKYDKRQDEKKKDNRKEIKHITGT